MLNLTTIGDFENICCSVQILITITNHRYHYSHHVDVSLSSFYGTIIEVSTLTENIIIIVVIIVIFITIITIFITIIIIIVIVIIIGVVVLILVVSSEGALYVMMT